MCEERHGSAFFRYLRFSFLVLLSSSATVLSQEPVEKETVSTRARYELAPIGLAAGSFLIYPQFTYFGMRDDNVFATNDNKQWSFVSEYSPAILLASNWGRHALNFSASADIGRNHTFSSEDYEDWDLSTSGRLDIRENIWLDAGVGVGRDHVPRSSPNDVRGLEPTKYDKSNLFANYTHKSGRFTHKVNTKIKRKDYENVPAIRNGQAFIINNDSRDRTEYSAALRSSYRYQPKYATFIRIEGNVRDYKEEVMFFNTNTTRSSKGYEALFGIALDLGGETFGELSAGYRAQNYHDPYPDISTPVVDASLNWNVTGLTTLGVEYHQFIRETVSITSSGYIASVAEFNVSHELRRNVLLDLSLFYEDDNYRTIGFFERNDTSYNIAVSSTYIVNRHLSISLAYSHLQRDSSVTLVERSVNDFEKNLIFVSLQTQR